MAFFITYLEAIIMVATSTPKLIIKVSTWYVFMDITANLLQIDKPSYLATSMHIIAQKYARCG